MKVLFKSVLILCLTYLCYVICIKPLFSTKAHEPIPKSQVNSDYEFDLYGKDIEDFVQEETYTINSLANADIPELSEEHITALKHQLKLLKIRKQRPHQVVGNLNVSLCELEETINTLLEIKDECQLSSYLDAYRIGGKSNSGEVQFTSYYTPYIDVSKRKTSRYCHPIYSKPILYVGDLPTRKDIEQKELLEEQGLVLAYAKDKLDIYFMQVQGSGYVKYRNGTTELFSYGGSNGHPYRSIGRYLKNSEKHKIRDISQNGIRDYFKENPEYLEEVLYQNSSYTFFKPRQSLPKGAGHVPLSAGISIAVDRRYIPLGACLLASLPIYNQDGEINGHELKLLLAQDVGGAIKGAGHVDYYAGSGDEALKVAANYYHYGKMWLLLPKDYESGENRLVYNR